LGRDPECDLPLDNASISARHAELRLRGGVWMLSDLGSVNGSWVDGEPVLGALPLAPGSTVRLGEVTLSFAPRDRWQDSPRATLSEVPGLADTLAMPTPDPLPAEPARRLWPVVLFVAAALALLMLLFLFLRTS
jgi:pSer/pThr/pTyr-binding forkhead associated (FHA) protein